MYVFVDESGNTGAHLFDEAQPIFLTVALMTRTDFDAIYTKPIANLARAVGDNRPSRESMVDRIGGAPRIDRQAGMAGG